MATTNAKLGAGNDSSAWNLPYSMAVSVVFLIILCLSYATNAADRQIFPTLLPQIAKAFGYNLKVGGLLATIFTLGLAIAGIPTGYILDRTSRKAVIIIGMVIYSVFTLATISAGGIWDMLVYRAMTGIGEGMQMAGLFAAVGSYFHRRRSLFIGFVILSYGVGGFGGPWLGAKIAIASGGWKAPFVWFAFIGVAMAVIVLLVIPKAFSESKGPATTAAVDQAALAHMPTNLWNRNVILGFIGCVILGISLYGFLGLYTTFLTTVLKYPRLDAAVAFSFFGLGGIMSFAGGWCGDRFPQRWVIALAFGVFAVVGYSIYNVAEAAAAQRFLAFCVGCFGSGFIFTNLLSHLQRSVRPEMVGRASGLFIFSLFGAASIAGYSMGALVGVLGWGGAGVVQLTVLPVVGVFVMALVNPNQLITARAKK
jgi:MFS family permease